MILPPFLGQVRESLSGRTHHGRLRLAGWQDADTFERVGELTALWLEGSIPEQPGYHGGPDDETAQLVPTLAAACRAGFVTEGSQPGEGGTLGYDGRIWWQRAAVSGYVADPVLLERLSAAAADAGLWVIRGLAGRRRTRYDDRADVTFTEDGTVHTGFGAILSRRDVAFQYEGTHPDGVDAMVGAWQLTLVDPEPGRNDVLWPLLARFAHQGE